MNAGRTIFAQLIEFLPHKEFQKCVAHYRGDSNPRGFSCWNQYLAMDKDSGVPSDQTVVLASLESASVYPDALRKVAYVDAETGRRLVFLTNNFALPAATIAAIYKQRMYLDYAENQAARQIPMKMADWVEKLDAFLKFNEYDVLTNAGGISHEVAKELAEQRYESFRIVQDRSFVSDFERASKKMLGQKRPTTKREKTKQD